MQFVDTSGTPTDTYPYNPNGTSGGHTAYVNAGGNHVIMMPHPERVDDFDQIFYNLRAYAEEHNHST
jgi:phosphoribosylformylglycinamidine synthase